MAEQVRPTPPISFLQLIFINGSMISKICFMVFSSLLHLNLRVDSEYSLCTSLHTNISTAYKLRGSMIVRCHNLILWSYFSNYWDVPLCFISIFHRWLTYLHDTLLRQGSKPVPEFMLYAQEINKICNHI